MSSTIFEAPLGILYESSKLFPACTSGYNDLSKVKTF